MMEETDVNTRVTDMAAGNLLCAAEVNIGHFFFFVCIDCLIPQGDVFM